MGKENVLLCQKKSACRNQTSILEKSCSPYQILDGNIILDSALKETNPFYRTWIPSVSGILTEQLQSMQTVPSTNDHTGARWLSGRVAGSNLTLAAT